MALPMEWRGIEVDRRAHDTRDVQLWKSVDSSTYQMCSNSLMWTMTLSLEVGSARSCCSPRIDSLTLPMRSSKRRGVAMKRRAGVRCLRSAIVEEDVAEPLFSGQSKYYSEALGMSFTYR